MIRYLLNGAFLMVLSYLLIFNPSFKTPSPSPAVAIRAAVMTDIDPDSLIALIRSAEISVNEIGQVLNFLEVHGLMESDRGQAACYGLSKQVQQKINAGDRSKTLRNIIDKLAAYQMIVEVPKSDWSKLFTYSKECVFEDLHCDHLLNRVTGHPYFKGLIVLLVLLTISGFYLILKLIFDKKRLKINHFQQQETGNDYQLKVTYRSGASADPPLRPTSGNLSGGSGVRYPSRKQPTSGQAHEV